MTREFLLGTAAALLIAVPASALTMTLLEDDRFISARAEVGQFSDANKIVPDSDFSLFASEVGANASDVPRFTSNINGIYGATANAGAFQESSFGPLSIFGKGGANANASHGGIELVSALGDADLPPGAFDAQGQSNLDVLFSIDGQAAFDLEGFIQTGIGQAQGPPTNSVQNVALFEFTNVTTNTSIIDIEINGEDDASIDESGVLEAGTYRVVIEAFTRVRGQGEILALTLGDADTDDGYQAFASWGGNLNLRPIDKPIPEPVTTSLIGMSLGALVLRTSRRRKA